VFSTVRSAASRILCLSFAKTCSIGAVGRQKEYARASSADHGTNACSAVGAEIVEDDDVPFFQGWDENLLDIGGETLAVDGAVDHERRVDLVATQGGDKVIVFHWPCGALATSLRAFRTPAAQRCHIRLDPKPAPAKGLVDEDETGWIDAGLMRLPALTFARGVRSTCSLANRLFFETQPFLANESPNRTPIGLDPALRQFGCQAPRREPAGVKAITKARRRRLPTACAACALRSAPAQPEPVSRRRFTHFGAQEGSMPNAPPIDRIVSPASNRATARSRKSSE
jgi:hypothetical protein